MPLAPIRKCLQCIVPGLLLRDEGGAAATLRARLGGALPPGLPALSAVLLLGRGLWDVCKIIPEESRRYLQSWCASEG